MPAFTPAATAVLTAATTTSRVAVQSVSTVLRLVNLTGITVFFKTGDSTVTAATTDTPLPAGGVPELFSKAPGDTHIAVITATVPAVTTVYVTSGQGD